MADTKIVGGKGSSRNCAPKERKHHDDCADTPTPPFALTTTTIYARKDGCDKRGNGSVHKPFRTFQRAIRGVPLLPAPGARYIVDITDIGVEPLPDYYVLPNILFPTIDYANDLSIPYFYSGAGLCIRALLKLVALPDNEAVIAAGSGVTIAEDADTKLITLSIPTQRVSWTTANLRNKKLIRTVGTFKAGCVIVAATNAPGLSTLTLTNNADNFNAGVIGALTPDETLNIVEPSATLEGGAAPKIDFDNAFGFAGIISACNSIAFQGIDFSNRAGEQALGLLNSPNVPIELCNVAGLFSQGQAGQYFTYANGTLITYGLVTVSSSFFSTACHFDGAPAGFPFFFYIASATVQKFSESIFSDCDTFTPGEQGGLSIICNTAWTNVLMENCGGILINDGRAVLDHVQINTVVPTGSNPTGDGVRITEAGFGRFVHVTGTGITGYGAVVDNGSQLLTDLTTTIGNDGPRAYTNGGAVAVAWPIIANNDANVATFSRVSAS